MPWCAIPVIWALKKNGVNVEGLTLWTRDIKNWKYGRGVTRPQLGTIMQFARGDGGHQGIYAGETAHYWEILGGNQDDAINIKRFKKNSKSMALLGMYEPIEGSSVRPDEPDLMPGYNAPRSFFDLVRQTIFGGRLNRKQVQGLNFLIGFWRDRYAEMISVRQLAYNLGTTALETDWTMQPIDEYGDDAYFERRYGHRTKKGKELGNTRPGDGARFAGAGLVMQTGRRNARFSSQRLQAMGVDVDFEANPELRNDPEMAAHCLLLGNHEGWWTGRKLPDFISETRWDGKGARSVVNGSDRWDEIDADARAFLEALETIPDLVPGRAPAPEPIEGDLLGPDDLPPQLRAAIDLLIDGLGDRIGAELDARGITAVPRSSQPRALPDNRRVPPMNAEDAKHGLQSVTVIGVILILLGRLFPGLAPLFTFLEDPAIQQQLADLVGDLLTYYIGMPTAALGVRGAAVNPRPLWWFRKPPPPPEPMEHVEGGYRP